MAIPDLMSIENRRDQIQLEVSQYKIEFGHNYAAFYSDENEEDCVYFDPDVHVMRIDLDEDLYTFKIYEEPDLDLYWKKDKVFNNGNCFIRGLVFNVESEKHIAESYDLDKLNVIIKKEGSTIIVFTKKKF